MQEYRERKGKESSAFKGNQKTPGHWEEEGSTLTELASLIIPYKKGCRDRVLRRALGRLSVLDLQE